MSPKRPLTCQRVAVTGGGRGIGLATARELHARGAEVAIGDLDLDVAKRAAASIAPEVVALGLDVSDRDSFAHFLEDTKAQLGGLDVLVNNAGIMPIGPFLDLDPAVARRAVEINVLGVLTGMQLALPDLVAQGSGQIVNVASSAGRAAVPGGVTYCATKAAVVSMTEGARLEFGPRGVSFTCVMPSFTNTDLISGTSGTKGLKNVEPADLAAAIARAIERKQLDVYAPKALRPIFFTQSVIGRRTRDFMNRRLGAYETFLQIDHSKRDDYDKRISAS
jgi:NAD(P)-dependent dehydrogenase (short-subunit alcohol dehydrogenase family)